MVITPKFSAREIVDTTIKKDWFAFQNQAFGLGSKILSYMQSYINAHRKRQGGIGNLAKAMKLESSTGAGRIFWGIGNIAKLLIEAPGFYVVNYGKKITGEPFAPGGGKIVPGYFGGGNPPAASMKGTGTEHFTYAQKTFAIKPGVIRPMGYIQASRAKLNAELRNLLSKLKGAK